MTWWISGRRSIRRCARLLSELRTRQRQAAARLTPAERIARLFELVAFAERVRPSPDPGRRTDESWDDLRAMKARFRRVDAGG
ncbi:MAG: hypothetical protein IPJ34_40195 [Myxococcales bacterium]|nr:hypothetical protein [Myxococcales bacterium]